MIWRLVIEARVHRRHREGARRKGLPVINVSDVTGFPEMMDGRVKTLHPAVHAGILARRHRPDDLAALESHGIRPSISSSSISTRSPRRRPIPTPPFDALVEEIDIGGPSLLRAAAKNFRDVLVVVDPADYPAGGRGAARATAVRRWSSGSS